MSQPLPIWALRALTRIAEARIEHRTAVMNDLSPGDLAPMAAMSSELDAAHAAYVQHSTELRIRIFPAASSLAKAAPSGGAMQPDPSV